MKRTTKETATLIAQHINHNLDLAVSEKDLGNFDMSDFFNRLAEEAIKETEVRGFTVKRHISKPKPRSTFTKSVDVFPPVRFSSNLEQATLRFPNLQSMSQALDQLRSAGMTGPWCHLISCKGLRIRFTDSETTKDAIEILTQTGASS